MKTRYWPVEIIRTSIPTTIKGKKVEYNLKAGSENLNA
jgi:hypothetical protein